MEKIDHSLKGKMLYIPFDLGDKVYRVVEKTHCTPKSSAPWFAYVKTSKVTRKNFYDLIVEYEKTVFTAEHEAQVVLNNLKEKKYGDRRKRSVSADIIDMFYDSRHSDGLKVYASDEPREERCCGSCDNRVIIDTCSYKCIIDGHYISHVDCYYCWCKRWKRNRRFDNENIRRDQERVGV